MKCRTTGQGFACGFVSVGSINSEDVNLRSAKHAPDLGHDKARGLGRDAMPQQQGFRHAQRVFFGHA